MDEYEYVRVMQCPFCGHRCDTTTTGIIHCGPHGRGHRMTPASTMYEVDGGYWRHSETHERLKEEPMMDIRDTHAMTIEECIEHVAELPEYAHLAEPYYRVSEAMEWEKVRCSLTIDMFEDES